MCIIYDDSHEMANLIRKKKDFKIKLPSTAAVIGTLRVNSLNITLQVSSIISMSVDILIWTDLTFCCD